MFYPRHSLATVRGYALDLDGRTLAVGGLLYSAPLQAFSDMRAEAAKYPLMLMRLARRVCTLYAACDTPVVAFADERHPNSDRFLQRLGFVSLREGVYLWQPQPRT